MDSYLWFDKYAPKSLNELSYNPTSTKILQSLAGCEDFPHLIFYGVEGAGKKTRINAFLEAVYGKGVRKVTTESREFKVNSTATEYFITSSNFHIEMNPSDLAQKDKYLIQSILKETASSSQIDQKSQKKFKVVVILEADKLTRDAQASLRRTMEKYSSNCRIIMACNSLSKIIPPIRSRCLAIRVGAPSEQEIKDILFDISNKENSKIGPNVIPSIINSCEGNLRRAINCLQLCHLKGNTASSLSYKEDVKKVYTSLTSNSKSVQTLSTVRQMLFNIIVSGIAPELFLLSILNFFMTDKKISDDKKLAIIDAAVFYDLRVQNGSKAIAHLEAFSAKVLCILSTN